MERRELRFTSNSSTWETHSMSKSSIDVQKRLRGLVAPADSERSLRPSRLDSCRAEPGSHKLGFLKTRYETLDEIQTLRHRKPGRLALPASWFGASSQLVAIARLAPVVACAGVLTIAWPAAAQDNAAPDKAAPAPAPDKAPPAPENAAPDGAAPAPEKTPDAPAAPAQAGADAQAPGAEAEAAAEGEFEEAEGEEMMATSSQNPQNLDEITISGRRQSLAAALRRKRNSSTQVDAIIADDMAKFPDLNLAEALERVPGVSITRTNGEGSRITVRGLSGRYTRTRLNGIDARVALGTNTTREFDFNLFASELFNSIVVHKTATAELGEGSLGSVVDLNTGRAFNYKEGFSVLLSGQGNYNDLSQTVRPRMAGLVAYRDPKGLWGATASAAYSIVRNDSQAAETVRWQNNVMFRSVRGVICADNPTDPGCLEVRDAFHARIPRYLLREVSGNRLGLTAGVQVKPTKQTDIKLDAMYARFNTEDRYKTLSVLFRGNEQLMDVTDYTLQVQPGRFGLTNNTLTGLSVDNAWVRSENFLEKQENDFKQISLNFDHDFGHGFSVNAVGGMVRSVGSVPRSTTLMYDDRDYNGFSYDFGQDDRFPRITYAGPNVADATNFTLTEARDQVTKTNNAFDSVALKGAWEIFQPLTVSIGGKFESARMDTRQDNRDGTICGLMIYDCDADDNGTNELIGAPGQASLSETVDYEGRVGAGTTTRWVVPSIDGWTQALGYYNVPLKPNLNNIRKVKEETLGAFLQGDGEVALGGDMRLLYNAGLRYVQTRQTSGGYLGSVFTERKRPMYDNLLWSTNAALWVTEQVVVRAAVAEVMARPELQELSPGATVDSFGFKVNYQNPLLEPTKAIAYDAGAEWYFADESVLSLALFLKDIKTYSLQESSMGTFASTNLPVEALAPTSPAAMNPEGTCANAATTGCWEITRLQNGPGASLKGLEVGLQAPFSSLYGKLPPIIRNMGFAGNFTLIDSKRNYPFAGNTVSERLFLLSNTSVNATLYYEDTKFGARLSMANRSQYLGTNLPNSGPPVSGNLFEYTEGTTRFDFSSSYKLIKELEFTFEALNLTNTPNATGVDIDAKRRYAYTRTGRNFMLGARFTY
jgi:TonB-dependent receptor